MENRVQHIFLKSVLAALTLGISLGSVAQTDKPISGTSASINKEVIELGATAGIINIQDFGSEYLKGAYASFKATEDFFLQFNYVQSDIGLSSYEKRNDVQFFTGGDRTFSHYDLLVGYNLFQAEFFHGEGKANIASLHLVGGVGDTEFGGESSFTYTIGLGYQIAFARRYVVHFDYRNHTYDSALIIDEERSTNHGGITLGFGFIL